MLQIQKSPPEKGLLQALYVISIFEISQCNNKLISKWSPWSFCILSLIPPTQSSVENEDEPKQESSSTDFSQKMF